MKRFGWMMKIALALVLAASMLFAALPFASAEEDILGGLGSMFSSMLGGLDLSDDDEALDADDAEPADFYELMDSYEAFFNEYVEYMKNLDEDNLSDLSALADYTSMMARYAETMEKLDDIDEDELTEEELAYYIDVMARIEKKLLELS